MPFKPQFEGDFPTLGYEVVDWIENYLQKPDSPDSEPFRLYQEQVEFIVNMYRLDPATGKRKYHRAVLSRPRGWGKSPLAGALCAAEGLGPVLFDGWDADGQPVGKPWSEIRTPEVNIAAVSEDQTANTYRALLEMLESDALYDDYPGLEPMAGFVNLPRGQIRPIAASGSSIKGRRACFGILDQTEVWYANNGGIRLAETMRSNAAKLGGMTLETPNAFIPGENSVAEKSANYAQQIDEGKAVNDGLYWDHREAPADTDLSDRDSLMCGLRYAYGDAAKHEDGCSIHLPACPPGHVDLDRLIAEIWDPGKDVQVSRSDFLNQITHASDSWLSKPDLMAQSRPEEVVSEGATIVLGFDGSRGRAKGKADATALVGMTVPGKHLFTIGVWEKRQFDPQDWTPDVQEVDAVVRETFEKYNVVGFYADPSGWAGQVADWEAKFGRRLVVKATQNAPISAWPRGKTTRAAEYVDKLRDGLLQGEVTWDGSSVLQRHFLNARRRSVRGGGYLLYKAFPDSPDKIDAAYASVMAYKACLDAISVGVGPRVKRGARTVFMR